MLKPATASVICVGVATMLLALPAAAAPGGNGNGVGNAYGYGYGNGGGNGAPLPALGVTLLGQLGSAAAGVYLLWRRRQSNATANA